MDVSEISNDDDRFKKRRWQYNKQPTKYNVEGHDMISLLQLRIAHTYRAQLTSSDLHLVPEKSVVSQVKY